MNFLRRNLRFLAAVQLLPALESGEETLVGGQAVLEGVMMRSPHAWGICIRKPDGTLSTHCEPLERLSEKHKWMGWPVVRGVMTLGQAMVLGFRALRYSANVALDQLPAQEEKKAEIKGWVAAVNIIVSVGFFIFLYKFVPLLAATKLKNAHPMFGNQVMFNVPGVTWNNPTRAPGTGFLPGQPDPAPLPPCPGFPPAPVTPPPGTPCNCGCGCGGNLTQAWAPNWANPPAAGQAASPAALATSPPPWTWQTWQAFIDANGFPPPAGSQPPNWFGWYCVTPVMTMTLVGPMSSGLVLADGQNVSIQGSGNANIVEVFSV